MERTMKAAVCYEPGKALLIEDIDIDRPQPGEVRVRLAATAICHSDIHAIRGDWNGKVPVVVCHAAAAVVEEVGKNVTLAAPVENVVVSLLLSCGPSFYHPSSLSNHFPRTLHIQPQNRLP